MGSRVLFVLTSADIMGESGKPTGWYLPEMAHPYKVLFDGGFTDIDVVSPKGGKAPLDASSVEGFKDDPVCQWFLTDPTAQELVNNTKTPVKISGIKYGAVIFPGGHGPMFDLAHDEAVAKIVLDCYGNGGTVAAVCHGPAGLLPVRLPNGDPLVKGKKVTAFSNNEEDATGLSKDMPFSLEHALTKQGATFQSADNWQENVVVDGNVITGQNPASSRLMGEAVLAQLLKR